MAEKTGVLVVDDSAFMRKIIAQVVDNSAGFFVVDVARNGKDALEKLAQHGTAISLVTLDIQMPEMDGLTCLKEIMQHHPRRVVMVSSLTTEGARETLQALELGAIDFLAKPGGAISLTFETVAPRLIEILTTAAHSRLPQAGSRRAVPVHAAPSAPSRPSLGRTHSRLIAVASSTGGPKALNTFIPQLPKDLGAAMILVQHMPATFTKLLADRLNKASNIAVKEAEEGDRLREGLCLVAPGGAHMEISSTETIHLSFDPPIGGLRPCADVTFRTVATAFGARALGVVLTGMGHDATDGCTAMKRRGAKVLAESKETALIYGMPKSIVDNNLADRVVTIEDMAQAVVDAVETL